MRITVLAPLVATALVAAPGFAQPLGFAEALSLAELASPGIVARRHALEAAHAQVERAAELPDPKLRIGIENLPLTGADRYRVDRDFMTMRSIGWMQEFPNGDKRAARGERAARLRDVERSELEARAVQARREAAIAWLEVHYAERTRALLEHYAGQFALQADGVAAGIARGRQLASEQAALRLAEARAADRVIEAARAVTKARIALAALLGDAAWRPLAGPPESARLPLASGVLDGQLERHPALRTLDERALLARAEVEVARASRRADWSLEVGYGQRRPAFENMLSVMVAFELPTSPERRQDRDVESRLAEFERARAEREEARRKVHAELRSAVAEFEASARRLRRIDEIQRPLARERRERALAAYRAGRAEMGAVLEAERGITDVELDAIAVEAERGRAWALLAHTFGKEDLR